MTLVCTSDDKSWGVEIVHLHAVGCLARSQKLREAIVNTMRWAGRHGITTELDKLVAIVTTVYSCNFRNGR